MARKKSPTSKEPTLLAADRHRKIVAQVDREGSARAGDLAALFGVTQETIRLDLEKLESEGLLLRRHGGAVALHSLHGETPFHERRVALVEEKAGIARLALKEVKEGDTILLDASSTCWQLARMLPDMPLTVLTHAIKVVAELANRKNLHVICTGGTLSPASLSFVGPMAERCIREYHVDTLFLSCTGLDFERGVSDAHEWVANLKKCMMVQAARRVLMLDHSKFGVRALAGFGNVEDFDLVITDSGTEAGAMAQLVTQSRQLAVAETNSR